MGGTVLGRPRPHHRPMTPDSNPITRKAPTTMTTSPEATARAFSGHHFADAYPRLADDVRWTLVGGPTLVGRQAVIDTCEDTLAELATSTSRFPRFRTVVGTDTVVVDAVGEYQDSDGSVSAVASCDIFDFTGDLVTGITSYNVELSGE